MKRRVLIEEGLRHIVVVSRLIGEAAPSRVHDDRMREAADAELAAIKRGDTVDFFAGDRDGGRPPRLIHRAKLGGYALRHAERVARIMRRAQRMVELDGKKLSAELLIPFKASRGEDDAPPRAEELRLAALFDINAPHSAIFEMEALRGRAEPRPNASAQ